MPTKPPGSPTIDLTDPNDSGIINAAVFQVGFIQPAGTGVFNTFVQIQHNGVEQGYNSDNGIEQFDEKNAHRHSLLLANIPIVIGDGTSGTVEGVAYRQFVLDLNEPAAARQFISLDALQLWQEESGSLTSFAAGAGFAGAHTNFLTYDLDAGGDHWIGLTDGLSHGSGQSDVTVLIPDSFFINDTAHRYVYLYSAFGLQSGWTAEGGFEEWGTTTASPPPGETTAIAASKTATVPGGTADHAGEVITYDIQVYNVGDHSLTGITVGDPSVSDLMRGADIVGNNDNVLDVGETWLFTAHHTVTQAELDSNGDGSGTITNTATIDSNETGPVTASASVTVESPAHMSLVKTATVPGGTADAAGEVISYTLGLTNDGAITLTNPVVNDSMINIVTPIIDPTAPILNHNVQFFVAITDGDFNLGDTNQNGVWDAGETFQFAYPGDFNADGIHDPGETWTAINLGDTNNDGIHQAGEIWVGDTNQNGVEDPGERWQFKNLGDTNHNHLQEPGEVWQYANAGDANLNGVQDPGETFSFANVGDTNQNGVPDPGETFQFANAGDTNRNGIEDPGETFQFSVSHAVPGVDADNDGFNDGDTNHDGVLNVGETWLYAFTHTVTQDEIDNGGVVDPTLTIDNTADGTTDQAHASASASVPVEQRPSFAIAKTADVSSVDTAGDLINYTVTVDNTGNMTLTDVVVNDPFVTLTLASGDTNHDGKLDVDETWTYTGSHTVTQSEIDNGGIVDPTLAIHNTATADTDQTTAQSASASVAVLQDPHVTLDKTATVPGGTADTAGEVISYAIDFTNDGNMTLTNPVVSDPSVSDLAAVMSGGFNTGDTDHDGKVDVGETWHYTASHAVTQGDLDAGGTITNTASVTTDQGATSTDSASVTVAQNPHVSMTKSGTWNDTNPADGFAQAGETVHYSYAVANDGNVTLGSVALTDSKTGAVTGPTSGDVDHDGFLDVGETWLFDSDYAIQAADVTAGTVHNDATVTAVGPQTQPVSATASADVTLPQEPHAAMVLDKSDQVGTHFVDENENGLADTSGSGDLIQYIVVLRNTGNVSFHNVVVDDPLLGGPLGGPDGGDANNMLDPGETWVWDRNYFITDADASVLNGGGAVHNEATATALDPGNNTVTAHAVWDQHFPV